MNNLMHKKGILTTEYFPPISSFWLMNRAETVIIEECENYQKKSTRNRAKILGVNGVEVISVPLKKGKNSKMPITDVEISYDSEWVANHLHSIKSGYGSSPYFEYYFDDIEEILRSEHKLLVDLNASLVEFFLSSFDIDPTIVTSKDFIKEYPNEIIDVRMMSFNDRKIEGFDAKEYKHVFEEKQEFVSDLSAIDLLMCKGPEGIFWL